LPKSMINSVAMALIDWRVGGSPLTSIRLSVPIIISHLSGLVVTLSDPNPVCPPIPQPSDSGLLLHLFLVVDEKERAEHHKEHREMP